MQIFSSAPFRLLAFAAFSFVLLLPLNPARAVDFPPGVSAVWQAPVRTNAGGAVRVALIALNATTGPKLVEFPLSFFADLGQGGTNRQVQLRLDASGTNVSSLVPAGGFVRRDYVFELGAGLTGRFTLDLAHAGGGLLAMEVEPGPAPAGGNRELAGVRPAAKSVPQRAEEHQLVADPIGFFKRHVFPHEPIYFIAGLDTPNAKFQVSFKYRILANDDDTSDRWWEDFFVGYTQVSLWDWNNPSAPFFDTSYKPELLFSRTRLWGNDWLELDLAAGVQHESNGKDGMSSRSLNIAYLRPKLRFLPGREFQFSLQPRVWTYVGDLDDNPDLDFYRGHVELRVVAGWPKYVQLAALLRAGDRFNRGSAQFDLSVPLWFMRSPLAFQVQYFTGYGESLLQYNQRGQSVRAGFGLYY